MTNPEESNDVQDLGQKYADYIQRIREEKELYRLKAQVAKALSHESRLMIIDALSERDMCVGELTDLVGVDQSTVSKHLSILKNIGLIVDRKERSNKVFYHLTMPAICYFSELSMEVIKSNIPRAGFHAVRQAHLEPK